MIMSSCFAFISTVICGGVVFLSFLISPPDFKKLIQQIKKLDFKQAFSESSFLPIVVPALSVMALVMFISVNKQLNINNKTLVSYKKCEDIKKEQETKVAYSMLPKCIIASR